MLCKPTSRRRTLQRRLARRRAGGVKSCADSKQIRSCKTLRQPTCSPDKSRTESDKSSIKLAFRYHGTQQYSINALTDSSGTIKERYAYTAYGTPTIYDAAGTIRTTTAEGNRYTYTGREYDDITDTYHYRARIYLSRLGRFGSRDPIGYDGSPNNLYEYVSSETLNSLDPTGKIGVIAGCAIVGTVGLVGCLAKHRAWDNSNGARNPTGAERACVNKLFRVMPRRSLCAMNYKIARNGPLTLCNHVCRLFGQRGNRVYMPPNAVACSSCNNAIQGLLSMMHECVHVRQTCFGSEECRETEGYGISLLHLHQDRIAICQRLKQEGLCPSSEACLTNIQNALQGDELEFINYYEKCKGRKPNLPW
ncbi:tRNA3(Ser)-specific nuclease WapA precursor [Stieleria neptunia]|uniref:tRNA3(Ser)-specific nuclease WapA n=1 Tax=Stieleria neptunia TaxID=2527979 RepID=A0A518HUA3_9BACT|nr:RHS repeat-associated core domain-containing protein [Stieleria neptunia]QDV44440.1 tRNA3(Ser)-specific nuclease WapA precursor [Stieleria neptunia]